MAFRARYSLLAGAVLLLVPTARAAEGEITKPPAGMQPDAALGAIRNFGSDNRQTRIEAAQFFITNPDPRAFEAALRHSDSHAETDAEVRMNSVRALGEIGLREAYEPLLKCLSEEPEDTVKWVAVIALGKIHEPRAFDQLRQWIEGREHPEWRPLATYAIGYTKDKRAMTVLAAALGVADYRVRREAARALEVMGDPEGCHVILSHIEQETSGEAMRAAIKALTQLKCADALPVFDKLKAKLNTNDGEFKQMDQAMDEAAKLIRGKSQG